jgi:membrane protein
LAVQTDTAQEPTQVAEKRASAGSEAEFLREQSAAAKSALSATLAQARGDVKEAVDPRAWTRRYPWIGIGMAAAAGGAAAMLVVKRRKRGVRDELTAAWSDISGRDSHERRRQPPDRRSGTRPTPAPSSRPGVASRLAQAVTGTLASTVSGGIVAGATAAPKKKKPATRRRSPDRPAPRASNAIADRPHVKQDPPARSWWGLIKQTFADWSEDKAPRLGAALAYYTIFSIAPLFIIATAVVAMIYGDKAAAEGALDQQLRSFLGPEGAAGVQEMIAAARKPSHGIMATIIGIAALLFGASGVFGQLKDALNTIWEVEPKPGRGVWGIIRDRFMSFAMVLVIGFLLLVSLVLSAALHAAQNAMANVIPGPDAVMHVANLAVSFAVITLLFAMIYKFLPDVKIGWRDVWIGAAATALLFVIGKYLIGLYMGYAAVGSTYGAMGSLVVILVWVYYSAQILFMGAEFTQAYARMYGSRIVPAPQAQPVTAEARAQQGL